MAKGRHRTVRVGRPAGSRPPRVVKTFRHRRHHHGGGGDSGGAPDWVPANAKIHVDLVRAFNGQDAAWVDGTGVVAVDTLLGSDANTDGYWGATSYSSDDLTADGLVYSSTPPAIIGDALTKILAGSTFVIKTKIVGGGADGASFAVFDAEAAHAIEWDMANGDTDFLFYDYNSNPLSGTISDILNKGIGAINSVATTFTSSNFDVAVNGSDPVDETVSAPQIVGLVAAIIDVGPQALQSITIYDPLPDTTGLSTLSETGVTA